VFASTGILSPREIEITTSRDATTILEKIHKRAWSAEEVTTAFCKRAAMAHQMVRCLMDADFESAIRRARDLDAYQAETGKVVGPLHGLPISLKVLLRIRVPDQKVFALTPGPLL
jgi:amidase